ATILGRLAVNEAAVDDAVAKDRIGQAGPRDGLGRAGLCLLTQEPLLLGCLVLGDLQLLENPGRVTAQPLCQTLCHLGPAWGAAQVVVIGVDRLALQILDDDRGLAGPPVDLRVQSQLELRRTPLRRPTPLPRTALLGHDYTSKQ